jgi:hypothetical protein
MTGQDGYDSALSAIRNNVEDLGTWLAIWEARREPDAHARRCAADAVDAIDGALRDLYAIRQQLISEVQQADRATTARVDALLAGRDHELPAAIRPADTEGPEL